MNDYIKTAVGKELRIHMDLIKVEGMKLGAIIGFVLGAASSMAVCYLITVWR